MNLYCYCNNNSVTEYDLNGNISFSDLMDILVKVATVLSNILEDANNFDVNNKSEDTTLASHYFSFYKGSLVIRHSIPDTTSCGIFGMIFLNRNSDSIDLNHEWGHNKQERILGTPLYLFRIGIPSIIGYYTVDDDSRYYSQPWKRSADFFDGVDRSVNYTMSPVDSLVYLLTGLTLGQWNKIILFL